MWWNHNTMATITGWRRGMNHTLAAFEAVFTHRLIVSHDQAIQQRTRAFEKSAFRQVRHEVAANPVSGNTE
jgi:hypothetical protein